MQAPFGRGRQPCWPNDLAPHGHRRYRGRETAQMSRSGVGEQTWRKGNIGHFIGGAWCEAESGRSYQTRSPWTGEVLSEVAAGDGEDTRRAIEAAHQAFPAWAAALPGERQKVFLRAAEVVERRRDEVLYALALET